MTVQTTKANSLLSKINGAEDIRKLPRESLPQLCDEVRQCLIDTVSKTAGHLASGLGVVELTVALHYVFDTPDDILVWDVGHQAYPHKILTGHRDEFPTIRQPGGLHAFIWRNETPYDLISTGHASTSIGSALGLAVAQKFKPQSQRRKVIAIIGDGAISGGCAFEALNHAGSFKDIDLTVILNDNEWSISENVGSIAQGLSHIISNPHYVKLIEGGKRILKSLPSVRDLALRAQEHVKGMLMPGTLFEEFGFNYMGPVDGHDIQRLVNLLQNIKEMNGLNFLHIVTTKGKGYAPAEKDPTCYHGVPTFDPITGIKEKPQCEDTSYSNAFGRWMCDRAQIDRKLVGITPAMRVGSGMSEFAQKFPHQFFDVAIAEQHAMVFASGLAADGMRPVVNIYSSFMQRAYDGLIHDLAIQDLPVILTLDRGGVVGPDGPTHNGSFDIAFTRTVPNLVIMAPSSRRELYYMLNTAYLYGHPTIVRYPRANGESFSDTALNQYKDAHQGQKMLSLDEFIPIGQVECLHLASFHYHTLKKICSLADVESCAVYAKHVAKMATTNGVTGTISANVATVNGANAINGTNATDISSNAVAQAHIEAFLSNDKADTNEANGVNEAHGTNGSTDTNNASASKGANVANSPVSTVQGESLESVASVSANDSDKTLGNSQSVDSAQVGDSQSSNTQSVSAHGNNAGDAVVLTEGNNKAQSHQELVVAQANQTSQANQVAQTAQTVKPSNGVANTNVVMSSKTQSIVKPMSRALLDKLNLVGEVTSQQSHELQFATPQIKQALAVDQLLGLNLPSASLWRAQEVKQLEVEPSVEQALQGKKVAILAFGPMSHMVEPLAKTYDFSLFNMRFIKPLNEQLIEYLAYRYDLLVTLEEGAVLGGIGEHIASIVASLADKECSSDPLVQGTKARVLTLGLPDQFMMESPRDLVLKESGLDNQGILNTIVQAFQE